MNNFDYVAENIRQIKADVEEAKAKYRSTDERIDIMAVTKTVPFEIVNTAIENGLNLMGENRVQEYLSKKDFYDKNADVHFIGHLQTNKIKYIIENVSMIQSVDRIKLAKELSRQCLKLQIKKEILIEVNIGNEENKSGFLKDGLIESIYEMSELPNISIKGLMAIPPKCGSENFFYEMQKLFIDIRDKNIDNIIMCILSMGMSSDYIPAIKYGSNLIRIGTKLFGARK